MKNLYLCIFFLAFSLSVGYCQDKKCLEVFPLSDYYYKQVFVEGKVEKIDKGAWTLNREVILEPGNFQEGELLKIKGFLLPPRGASQYIHPWLAVVEKQDGKSNDFTIDFSSGPLSIKGRKAGEIQQHPINLNAKHIDYFDTEALGQIVAYFNDDKKYGQFKKSKGEIVLKGMIKPVFARPKGRVKESELTKGSYKGYSIQVQEVLKIQEKCDE